MYLFDFKHNASLLRLNLPPTSLPSLEESKQVNRRLADGLQTFRERLTLQRRPKVPKSKYLWMRRWKSAPSPDQANPLEIFRARGNRNRCRR
jgi:hypothetical protein